MTDDSEECWAALDSRLPRTWTMRSLSAMTRGRSGPISMARLFLPPALMKALLARSTSAATSAGSGATGSVPVSMRATSSRSATRSCMWSACSSMMRKNWRTTAGSRSADEPKHRWRRALDGGSGAPAARGSPCPGTRPAAGPALSSAVMSWRVTTTDSTSSFLRADGAWR